MELNKANQNILSNLETIIDNAPQGTEISTICGLIFRQTLEIKQKLDELETKLNQEK